MWTQCRAQPAGHDLGPAWCRLQQLLPEVLPWQDGAQQLSGTSYCPAAAGGGKTSTVMLPQQSLYTNFMPWICPRSALFLYGEWHARGSSSTHRPWPAATLFGDRGKVVPHFNYIN